MRASLAVVLCVLLTTVRAQEDETAEFTKLEGYETTYKILTPGDGAVVTKGSKVTVHATGIVQNTGKKFWSTKDKGQQPFSYSAGTGGVITGWDQGCLGMKLGEVRQIIIPAKEGYGEGGFPSWGIPPGGILDFEIEILKIA